MTAEAMPDRATAHADQDAATAGAAADERPGAETPADGLPPADASRDDARPPDEPARATPSATVPLDALRRLVLRAYPEALPELVAGETWEELVGSAERAVALRARLLTELQRATPPVSAGAPRRLPEAEAGRLSLFEKIARALGRERS